MEKEKFERLMIEAKIFGRINIYHDYYSGYVRGLRRLYHGEEFGSRMEHDIYLKLIDDEDESRCLRGWGYRDGLKGLRANCERWGYCTQNDHDCKTCSLVNYGRDCKNNPV